MKDASKFDGGVAKKVFTALEREDINVFMVNLEKFGCLGCSPDAVVEVLTPLLEERIYHVIQPVVDYIDKEYKRERYNDNSPLPVHFLDLIGAANNSRRNAKKTASIMAKIIVECAHMGT